MMARTFRSISIGAGAVVVHENKVLLVRNIRGVTRGRYLLPAGFAQAGELPDQAAARETFEETNLRVEIAGLMGVRIWVMESGEHNYFFMFKANLLSPISDLRIDTSEIDDARLFSEAELVALSMDETWAGGVAIALKALGGEDASIWPNDANLSSDSGVDASDKWRIWM